MPTELGKKMLIIVAKRGYTGADREVFFHHIRGIRYAHLEKEVLSLEKEGFIYIEWVGPSNFTVFITPRGAKEASSYQKDVWHKSTEALEKLQETKHRDKSIVLEEVGYSKIIGKKMHVEEVGPISDELTHEIDAHIKAERAAAAEGTVQESIGVPAVENIVEEKIMGIDKDVVEKRIEGEIKGATTTEGKAIPPPPEDLVIEDETEGRIAKESGVTIESKVKEKRIEGEIEGMVLPSDVKKSAPTPEEVPPAVPEEEIKEAPSIPEEEIKEAPSIPEDIGEVEAPHGFSYTAELTSLFDEPPKDKAETEAIPIIEGRCFWDPDEDCPLVKSSETGQDIKITPNHCMVCQLVKVKELIKK